MIKVDDDVCFDSIDPSEIPFSSYTHFCSIYLDSCDVVGPIMGIDKKSDPKHPHWYIYGFVTNVRANCEPAKKWPFIGTKIVAYLDWIFSILEMTEN